MKKVFLLCTFVMAMAAVFIFGSKAEVKDVKAKVTTVAQNEHVPLPAQAVEKIPIAAAVTNTMFTAMLKTSDQCCPACHSASALPPNLPAGMYNNSSGDIGIGTNAAVMPCPAGFNTSSFGGVNKHKAVLSAVVLKPAWYGSNTNTLTKEAKEAVATNDITVLRLEKS